MGWKENDEDVGALTQRSAIILHKPEPLVEREEENFELNPEIAKIERNTPERICEAFNEEEARMMPHEV